MTEDELLAGLMEAMFYSGWRAHHVRRSDLALQMGEPGIPDILAVPPRGGPLLALELKAALGVVTDDQSAWLVGLAQTGATVAVIRPRDYDRALRLILGGISSRESWAWAFRAAA